jgi:DNA-directed RNA polymerase specialized sigma24 family protein
MVAAEDPTTRAEASTDEDLARLRQEYIDVALPALRDVTQRVHEALDEAAGALSVVRDHLRSGGRVSDFASLIDPIPLRAGVSATLNEFEHVRHEAQRAMFRLLRAEGMSISDIARMWGISRQLVSRMLHESD